MSKVLILHYELFASSLKKEKLHGTTSDQEEEGVSLATLSRIMPKKYDRYNITFGCNGCELIFFFFFNDSSQTDDLPDGDDKVNTSVNTHRKQNSGMVNVTAFSWNVL